MRPGAPAEADRLTLRARHSGTEIVGWAKPPGRAYARPMTGSACPPSFQQRGPMVGTSLALLCPHYNSAQPPQKEARIPAMRKLPVVHLSTCAVGQITTMLPRVPPSQEGRFAIVTNVGSGMRWTLPCALFLERGWIDGKTRTPRAARMRTHIPSLVMPAHAGIEYAAASRLKHCRLWNTGSPGQARLDRATTMERDRVR
jgi:hypothetical protein